MTGGDSMGFPSVPGRSFVAVRHGAGAVSGSLNSVHAPVHHQGSSKDAMADFRGIPSIPTKNVGMDGHPDL